MQCDPLDDQVRDDEQDHLGHVGPHEQDHLGHVGPHEGECRDQAPKTKPIRSNAFALARFAIVTLRSSFCSISSCRLSSDPHRRAPAR